MGFLSVGPGLRLLVQPSFKLRRVLISASKVLIFPMRKVSKVLRCLSVSSSTAFSQQVCGTIFPLIGSTTPPPVACVMIPLVGDPLSECSLQPMTRSESVPVVAGSTAAEKERFRN